MAPALSDAFLAALERRRATGERVGAADLPAACAARLREWDARRALVPGDDLVDRLGVCDALRDAGVDVVRWPAGLGWRDLLGLDGAPATCAVTLPVAAVAERGTLLIAASAVHGRAMDAVGWWHLAILPEERIVATLAQALTAAYAGGAPPSAISLVSGPSRTSDVEKITTYGAHGALAEHVLIVGG